MAARGNISVLLEGETQHAVMDFAMGNPVPPFSVGARADWRVDGRGVEPIHMFLYFDGTTVFASAVEGRDAPRIGQVRLDTTWTQLPPHCDIVFGAARARISSQLGPAGHAAPSPAPLVLPPGREPQVDIEATLAIPDFDWSTLRLPEAPAAASPPEIQGGKKQAQSSQLTLEKMAKLARAADRSGSARVPASRNGATAKSLVASTASGPPFRWTWARKLAVALAPVALLVTLRPDLLRLGSKRPRPVPVAAKTSTTVSQSPANAPTTAPATARPTAPATAPATTVPMGARPAVGPAPVVLARHVSARAAVDALAAGAFEDAAVIYEHLAAQNPSAPAFAEAARLCRRRATLPDDGPDHAGAPPAR